MWHGGCPPHTISCARALPYLRRAARASRIVSPLSPNTSAMLAFAAAPFATPLRTTAARAVSPRACAPNPSAWAATPPPTTVDGVVRLAAAAVDRAARDGHVRLRVDALPPGLNPAVEQTVPLSASLLAAVARAVVRGAPALAGLGDAALLFSSAGTAAAADAQFARAGDGADGDGGGEVEGLEVDVTVSNASFSLRDAREGRASKGCNVLVAPKSARGDRVMDDLEAVMGEAEGATWILLNAELGLDRAAVGIRESGRRAAFEESFVQAFYFRNLVSCEFSTWRGVALSPLFVSLSVSLSVFPSLFCGRARGNLKRQAATNVRYTKRRARSGGTFGTDAELGDVMAGGTV